MSESPESVAREAQDIAEVARMQIRRDIDAYRARAFWQKTLATARPEAVVEGLVLALSSPIPLARPITFNVKIEPGCDAGQLVQRIAALLSGTGGGT